MNNQFAFFLHMYQPPFPVQTPEVLDRIINNSYIPLTAQFIQSGHRLTVNINASLTEMLLTNKNGSQVIENLQKLVDNDQIEFLESGAYHPIFPLISPEFVEIQIKLNNQINSKLLGSKYKPVGIFPPELALNNTVAKQLAQLNYKYSLASDPTFGTLPFDCVPYFLHKGKKFFIIRRNRYLSNDIAFKSFQTVEDVRVALDKNFIPVIGMDWETFGEHHADYIPFLIKMLTTIKSLPVNEYLDTMIKNDKIMEISLEDLKPSSWSTEPGDIVHGIPFPLWDNPANALHQDILILMDILDQAVRFIDKNDRPIDFYKSQQSCQLWWCSEGRFGPSIVKRAISYQISTLEIIRNLSESYSKEKKQALTMMLEVAEKIVKKINYMIELKSFVK